MEPARKNMLIKTEARYMIDSVYDKYIYILRKCNNFITANSIK